MRRSSNAAAGRAQLQSEKRETTIRESRIARLGDPAPLHHLPRVDPQRTRIIGRSCPAARPTPDGVASLCPAPILEASAETLSTLMPPAVAKVYDAFAKDLAGPKYRICSSSFSLITSLTKLSASLDLKVGPITCRSCSRGAGDRSYPISASRF